MRPAMPVASGIRTLALTIAIATVASLLVAVAQVRQTSGLGALLSTVPWFYITRRLAPRRAAVVVCAGSGFLIALATRLLVVNMLHLPLELTGLDGSSARVIGSALGFILWPIVGACIGFLFAAAWIPRPSVTGKVIEAGALIVVGGVLSLVLGIILGIPLVLVLGESWVR